MSEAPEKVWLKEGYNSWGQYGHWYAHRKGGGIEYIRSDRIEELERNISAAERLLKRLARWLDLSDEELNNLTIGSIIDDHRKMQSDVNAAIAALKGETDE